MCKAAQEGPARLGSAVGASVLYAARAVNHLTRGANLAMLVVVNDFVAQEKSMANLLVEGDLMFGRSGEPQLNGVVVVVVH